MTAFEVDCKLYQFPRLPFGGTNAVPAFQRIVDWIVEKRALERTHPYFDDVIIGGRDKEEHDRNLDAFLSAAKSVQLTINEDKSVFGVSKISFLGHIIEKGCKKPDPERLQALIGYPVPSTLPQLRLLLGLLRLQREMDSELL